MDLDEFLDGIGAKSRMRELGCWQKWIDLP